MKNQQMQLTPEILQSQNHTLLEKVKHSEFNAFLGKHAWKSAKMKWIYYLILVLILVLSFGLLFHFNLPYLQKTSFAAIGVFIAFLLIPVHEFIHYFMYKYYGARDVTISFFTGRGYVLTLADRFVVDKYKIKRIALAPFFIISLSSIIMLFFVNELWQISIAFMVLFHASLCHGDFRIVDFFVDEEKDILMYDDVKASELCIYEGLS